MLRKIKWMFFCAILGSGSLLTAQDSLGVEALTISDSLQDKLLEEMEKNVLKLENTFRISRENYETITDSLEQMISLQSAELCELNRETDALWSRLAESDATITATRSALSESRQRITRVLNITLPSILLLIVISTGLFFILLNRYQRKTDIQIRTLRKYAHDEVEGIRTDYMKEIKRRVKKFTLKMKREKKRGKRKK